MRLDKNKLTIRKVRITASRFPWQSRSGMTLLSDPKTEGFGKAASDLSKALCDTKTCQHEWKTTDNWLVGRTLALGSN